MSQFIETNDKLIDWKSSHRDVVRGVFSRIEISKAIQLFKQAPNEKYFEQHLQSKVAHEESDANKIHHLSIYTNYNKLKRNLTIYGRSKSHMLSHVFEKDQNPKPETKQGEQIKKISFKPDKMQRVVLIDRKYNKELAIKAGTLLEFEKISKLKENYRRALSSHQSSPLVTRVEIERRSNFPDSLVKNKKLNFNPVIISVKNRSLQKRKKKQNYFKGGCKNKVKQYIM